MNNQSNNKIRQSRRYQSLPGLILLLACTFSSVNASEKEANNYEYLKSLNVEELMKVEVTLDKVFDVFNGLIKAEKVTVATGTEQSIARAPAITTVITAQDIEAMGARDLDEVLETVPGLHVAKNNQAYQPIYTVRGIYSSYNSEILMLINGIPITAIFEGDRGAAWGGMPINMIARIEVIRGPGSAVYGADAFAGVINIMTKTKEDLKGTEVGARIGSFKTYEGWALYGDTWNGVDITASLEYRTTDGQKGIISADAQTHFDKLFGTQASLAPGPVNVGVDSIDARVDVKKEYWQARAGYQGRRNVGYGAGVAQALTPEGYATADRENADLTYHNPAFAPDWDVTAQLSYLGIAWEYFEDRLFPRGAFGGAYPDGYIGNAGISERHTRLDTFAFYSGFQKHLVRLGIGYHVADQYKVKSATNFGVDLVTGLPLPTGGPIVEFTDTPYNFNKKAKRKNGYISLQDTWTMAKEWELTTGIRYDDYSDFGNTINPRLALVWLPRQSFTTKLMYGKAFRAPAFNELYNIGNPVSLGSPNLKPETLDTWEWAFDYRATQHLHLAANVFRYDIEDKMALIPNADGENRTFQNVGRWKGQGLELEARWKTSTKSSLLANYSYVKASDKGNGSDIGNYPRHSAYLRTDWLLVPHWYLDVQANWVADRQRTTTGDPRPAIADYTTVDLTLRHKDVSAGQTNFALGIRNLFNADAREPSSGPDSSGMIGIPDDLPLAERNYFLELRYQFY